MLSGGVNYFPLNVQMGVGDAIERIENTFGIKGFAVIVKLYQRIYGQEGYYCEWNDDVLLSFSARTCLMSANSVSEIVNAAIERGIFDKRLYQTFGILTSSGIQKRYLKMTERRKDVEIKQQYLLVGATPNTEDDDIERENVDIFPENADNFSQKKIKENKVKENKIKEKESEASATAFKAYQDNIGALSSIISQKITAWLDDVDESLIVYAIEQAVENNKRSWSYINAILNNHFTSGRKTRLDAESYKPKKKTGNKFLNFEQKDVDTNAIEEALIRKRQIEQGILNEDGTDNEDYELKLLEG